MLAIKFFPPVFTKNNILLLKINIIINVKCWL